MEDKNRIDHVKGTVLEGQPPSVVSNRRDIEQAVLCNVHPNHTGIAFTGHHVGNSTTPIAEVQYSPMNMWLQMGKNALGMPELARYNPGLESG